MEAVERAAVGHQARTLRLEGLPDRAVLELGMRMGLGIGDALVEQPSVQLVVALHPEPRGEEALPHQADLVLDLALLPARCRRAGHGIDEVVSAHLQEAAIVGPLLAGEDRLHRRLHVVVDAAPTGTLEEGERPVVGVEHHLLALPRIGPHEQHAAVAQADVGHLHGHGRAVDQHDLVAPIELVGLARVEGERHIGLCHRGVAIVRPAVGVAAHCIIAALIPQGADLLEDADQRQPFSGCLPGIVAEKLVEPILDRTNLGKGLRLARVNGTPSRPTAAPCGPPSAKPGTHGRSP